MYDHILHLAKTLFVKYLMLKIHYKYMYIINLVEGNIFGNCIGNYYSQCHNSINKDLNNYILIRFLIKHKFG